MLPPILFLLGRGRAEGLPVPPALPPVMIRNVVTDNDEEDDDADADW